MVMMTIGHDFWWWWSLEMIDNDDLWWWWCSTACTLGWVAISWARFCGPCETLCWIGWAWPRDIRNGVTCFSCFSFQDKMWGGNKGTSGWMLKLALTGLCWTVPLLRKVILIESSSSNTIGIFFLKVLTWNQCHICVYPCCHMNIKVLDVFTDFHQ